MKYSKSLFANVHSSRQKWQAIRKLSKRSPIKTHITNELADELNVKFSSSFVTSDIHEFNRSPLRVSSALPNSCVSEYEVFKELKCIRSSSSGHDTIKGWILKRYAFEFASPLSLIFTRCLQDCYFPVI